MEKLAISPSLDISLESLNKRNHSTAGSLCADTGLSGLKGDASADAGKSGCNVSEPSPSSGLAKRPGVDPVGSLSDSLYDSFSSCTSQGSNGVWEDAIHEDLKLGLSFWAFTLFTYLFKFYQWINKLDAEGYSWCFR